MRRLAVICARGGSKGVAGKALRRIAKKTLIAHTVSHARDSGMFDVIAVSSDSEAILEEARTSGVEQLVPRPADLATDQAPKIPAIRHCTEVVEQRLAVSFDTIMDLDITAPLRNLDDIRGAIQLLESEGAPNVVSAMPATQSPYWNVVELDEGGNIRLCKEPDLPFYRRQDGPACYTLTGAVYAWSRQQLLFGADTALVDGTVLFIMPEERAIDINTELDLAFVQFLMERSG